jgi:Ca2+-transporting ATPase
MIVGQILIVRFGGAAFQVKPIDIIQWLICVGLGFLSLPVGVVIRLIPIDFKTPSTPSPEAEVDLEKDWNDAIRQVRSQLKIFKTLRGGRFRAHFGDRKEKSETRSKAFMAAAMLPSLISASVGVQMTRENTFRSSNENTIRKGSMSEDQQLTEKPENPNLSEEKSENPNASEENSESRNGANVDKIEVR